MTASLPCMQWLAEPGPAPAAGGALDRRPRSPTAATSSAGPGLVRNSQATCGGTFGRHRDDRGSAPPASTKTRPRASSSCQRRSRSWTQAGTSPIRSYVSVCARMPSAAGSMSDASMHGLAEQRVGARCPAARRRRSSAAGGRRSRPTRAAPARPATFWRIADAVVDDELEVEVRDPDAGVALARGRLADVAPAPPEAEVAALDRVEQHRPVDPSRRSRR